MTTAAILAAKRLQCEAEVALISGCFTDCWLDDKVGNRTGAWSVRNVRVDDLMEVCAAVLNATKKENEHD